MKGRKAFIGSEVCYGSWKISRACQVERAGGLFPEPRLALKWMKCLGLGEISVTRLGDEERGKWL